MIDGQRGRIRVGDLVRGVFMRPGVFGMVTGISEQDGRLVFEVDWHGPGATSATRARPITQWDASELQLVSALEGESEK